MEEVRDRSQVMMAGLSLSNLSLEDQEAEAASNIMMYKMKQVGFGLRHMCPEGGRSRGTIFRQT